MESGQVSVTKLDYIGAQPAHWKDYELIRLKTAVQNETKLLYIENDVAWVYC